jgi:chromosomal replication initiation ATPase DnaA
VSEPSESAAESTSLAWDHLYSSSSPGLRRWLTTGQPVALHQDMLMVAVPNIFTRNQLENRFRPDIERLLSGYFGRSIQLAVIVDESLKPADDSGDEPTYDDTPAQNARDYNGEGYRENGYSQQAFGSESFPAEQHFRSESGPEPQPRRAQPAPVEPT